MAALHSVAAAQRWKWWECRWWWGGWVIVIGVIDTYLLKIHRKEKVGVFDIMWSMMVMSMVWVVGVMVM